MPVQLQPNQLKAVNQLKNGSVLYSETGVGKSITAIAYFYKENGGVFDENGHDVEPMHADCRDLYIITTAKKRDSHEWDKDLAFFCLSSVMDFPECNYGCHVTVDSWNNVSKYRKVHGAFFIFDEQRVVGGGTWVKSFLDIARKNQWILLTATPGDKWTDYIPLFIANGYYRTKTQFTNEHCIYSTWTKYPSITGYMNVDKLMRIKSEILVEMDSLKDTTPHHIDISCDYKRNLYKVVMRNRWDIYKDEPCINAAALCYVLRRVVNEDISRSEAVWEIVLEKKKCIIFYNFDYELNILRNLFGNAGYEFAEWNGHKHEDVPKSDKWVYLVQYTAGAEGWNCITTDTIIFYSQTYSYKTLVQAQGRTDRWNTKFKDLYYYHLKSPAPIDLAVSKALKEKKKFNETKWIKW